MARFRVTSRWHAVKATRAVFFSDTQSWPAGMGYIVARFFSLFLSLPLSLRPSVINESISQCNTPLRGRRYESAAASLTERGRGSGNQRRFPFLIEPRDFRVNHHHGGKLKEGKKRDGKSTWSTRFYKRIPFICGSSRSNRMRVQRSPLRRLKSRLQRS